VSFIVKYINRVRVSVSRNESQKASTRISSVLALGSTRNARIRVSRATSRRISQVDGSIFGRVDSSQIDSETSIDENEQIVITRELEVFVSLVGKTTIVREGVSIVVNSSTVVV